MNVSQSGVLVQGLSDQDLDVFVRIRIFLPPQHLPIQVLGRIARKILNQGHEFYGIQFIEMDFSEQNTWLEYISRIEALTLSQAALTTTSHLLQNRKLRGRGSQSLIFRFSSLDALKKFLSDLQSDQGFFIPVPLVKSIGEKIDLAIIRPDDDLIFDTEAEVLSPQGMYPSAERMGLKIKMVADQNTTDALTKFLGPS